MGFLRLYSYEHHRFHKLTPTERKDRAIHLSKGGSQIESDQSTASFALLLSRSLGKMRSCELICICCAGRAGQILLRQR